jgi:hypothetical protein
MERYIVEIVEKKTIAEALKQVAKIQQSLEYCGELVEKGYLPVYPDNIEQIVCNLSLISEDLTDLRWQQQ